MTNAFARIDPEAVFAGARAVYGFRRRNRRGELQTVYGVELLEGAKLTVAWGEVEGGPGSFLLEFGRGDFCIVPPDVLLDSKYEPLNEFARRKLEDIRWNFKRVPRTHLQELARLLQSLLSDPHPGLRTWHEACAHVVQRLREAVFYNAPSPTSDVADQHKLVNICEAITNFDPGASPSLHSFAWTSLLRDLRAALQ